LIRPPLIKSNQIISHTGGNRFGTPGVWRGLSSPMLKVDDIWYTKRITSSIQV
jgi:hypothetical protein